MTVENTSNRPAIAHLAGAMSEGVSGYIEGMEAAGQAQLVNSDVLPATAAPDYNSTEHPDQWPLLEALGIVRGEPVTGDPLFIHATLPAGWTRGSSEHAMHSFLLDERGVRRAAIFYKAAHYDRRADIRVVHVGSELASEAVYGSGPAALPDVWPVLTDDERDEFRASLDDYRADYRAQANQPGGSRRVHHRMARVDALTTLVNGTVA